MPRARAPLATVALIGIAALSAAGDARANGRFPAAGQIALLPGGGPTRLVVQATYGLVLLNSAGEGGWICEQAVGYGGEQDPPVLLSGDGALLVAPSEGLRVSVDGGCSFDAPAGALAGATVTDLAFDPSDPSRVYATTSPPSGVGASRLARSSDGGRSFEVVGELGEGLLTLTVEVAPSDPSRVAVTALEGAAFEPVLLVSDDAGASFTRRALPAAGTPYLSAIDPADPDRLYLRMDADGDDALYVSDDGGATTSLVTTSIGPMLGFALSPDGARVAIGGPQMGVRVADASSLDFEDAARVAVRCLRWSDAGLFACGEVSDGLIVARSFDDGQSFEPMLATRDLAPLACTAGTTTGDECPGVWPEVASLLGAGAGGEAPSSGASTGGEGPPTGRDAGGCAAAARGGASGWWALLAAIPLLGRSRRRRAVAREIDGAPPAG